MSTTDGPFGQRDGAGGRRCRVRDLVHSPAHTRFRYRGGMANTHGRLPKADPDALPDELRQRLNVWFDKAYKDDNLFLTLANRPGVLDMFLNWVSFVYTDASSLDPKMVELCRIRMAARNQCVH